MEMQFEKEKKKKILLHLSAGNLKNYKDSLSKLLIESNTNQGAIYLK